VDHGDDLDSFPDEDPPVGDPLNNGGPVEDPSLVEVAVNTDPVIEDAGIGTEPVTHSVGIGTEFSTSESDSDSEPDAGSSVSEDSESLIDEPPMPIETTPIPTPIATPTESRSPSPPPADEATPLPSTSHVTASDLSPVHTIPTPALSQASSQVSVHDPFPSPVAPGHEGAPVISQQVLARWPDDGWYYRSVVVDKTDGKVKVQDASGDTEIMQSEDIITDLVDSQEPIQVHVHVYIHFNSYMYII